jgi:hypothetical protein
VSFSELVSNQNTLESIVIIVSYNVSVVKKPTTMLVLYKVNLEDVGLALEFASDKN